MRRERRTKMKAAKKLLAGMLAAAIMICGMAVVPTSAANDGVITMANGIAYVPYASVMYSADETAVPVREDYVFGGWYQKEENSATAIDTNAFSAMREKPAAGTDTANVYAKYVPAYVLSVKMQVTANTAKDDNAATTMRVLSAVDNTNYREVGFEIYLGTSKTPLATKPVTTVYKKLKLDQNDGDADAIEANTTFGVAAQYFSGIDLSNIADSHDASIVYVRPYWITLDGTKVEGMARNLHVEDEYNNYTSVPVNILSGEAVAGGRVTLTYDTSTLAFVADTAANGTKKGFEAGRLLTEMEYNVDETNGTITIVGNATEVDANVAADGLFANIRFTVKKDATEPTSGSRVLTRKESGVWEFCNWNETAVTTVTVWDYIYGAGSAADAEN